MALDLRDAGFRPVAMPKRRTMSVFNRIASMQRLEAAGFKRTQAEALADELRDAMNGLVTNEQLTKELDALADKLTLRICGILGGLLTIGFAALGLAIALS
jgi:hypothetical protein